MSWFLLRCWTVMVAGIAPRARVYQVLGLGYRRQLERHPNTKLRYPVGIRTRVDATVAVFCLQPSPRRFAGRSTINLLLPADRRWYRYREVRRCGDDSAPRESWLTCGHHRFVGGAQQRRGDENAQAPPADTPFRSSVLVGVRRYTHQLATCYDVCWPN